MCVDLLVVVCVCVLCVVCCVFFLQAEDGIRDLVRSRGLGDVYKRQGEALGLMVGLLGTGHVVVPEEFAEQARAILAADAAAYAAEDEE